MKKSKVEKLKPGVKIGKLTLIKFLETKKVKHGKVHLWEVRCDCGTFKIMAHRSFLYAGTKSCGCYIKEATGNRFRTHGLKKHPSYEAWRAMIRRCFNPGSKDYHLYLGRGIGLDDSRWLKIENFIEDMGVRPKGLSLDRIDNDKGYSKDNCRWATWYQQASNTRKNKFFEVNGKKQILSKWARDLNVRPAMIKHRLNAGWPIEEALTRPSGYGRYRRFFK